MAKFDPMIHIQIAEDLNFLSGAGQETGAFLAQAAEKTLQLAGPDQETEITLVLTGDEQVQALNRDFLGIDAPTDVLSFPSGETDPDSEIMYLGDVVISYPRAQQQAEGGGHSIKDELQLLAVHGVLHLLGHDHAEPEEKDQMWALQNEALDQLGSTMTRP